MNRRFDKYYRTRRLPHIWCPGCGNGIILNGMMEAFDRLKIDQDKTVIVSGIGCSSRAPLYMNFDTLHTTHGRAIAFATGVKMNRPDLNVIVITGDGDAASIGGNHLIHAARRNIDLTVICFNNFTYGMTNGQYSPTTTRLSRSATSPYGSLERPFDLCKLLIGAGASYVARGTTYHVRMLPALIVNAINNKGFSFVEILTQCPTYFGRANKMGSPSAMLRWLKDNSVRQEETEAMQEEERSRKFVLGEFVNRPGLEYSAEYEKLIAAVRVKEGK